MYAQDGGNAFYAGEPVILDFTLVSVINGFQSALVEWGEYTMQPMTLQQQYALFPARQVIANAAQMRQPLSHVYGTPGVYTINVMYSDAPYGTGNAAAAGLQWLSNSTVDDGRRTSPACLMSSGVPCVLYPLTIQVQPSRVAACRPIISVGWTMPLVSTIFSKTQDTYGTIVFQVTLAGGGACATIPGAMLAQNADGTWTLPVPINYMESDSSLLAQVSASDANLAGCGIMTAQFDVTAPWVSLVQAGTLLSSINVPAATSINAVHVSRDECGLTQSFMYFGLSGTTGLGSFGGIALQAQPPVSVTGPQYLFSNYNILQMITSAPAMCPPSLASTPACTDAILFDIRPADDQLIVLSSRGLYTVSAAHSTGPATTAFVPVLTGNSDLDAVTTSSSSQRILLQSRLIARSYCHGTGTAFVLTYNPTTGANLLQYDATSSVAAAGTWSSVIRLTDLPGVDATYRFISAIRNVEQAFNVYLVGRPVSTTSADGVRLRAGCSDASPYYCSLYNSAMVIVHDTVASTYAVSFQFPNATILSHMDYHAEQPDVYIIGTDMWLSADGGRSFRLAYTFANQPRQSALGQRFVQATSSRSLSAIALLSDTGAVFYGRIGSTDIVPVRVPHQPLSATPSSSSQIVSAITFDDTGVLVYYAINSSTMAISSYSVPYVSATAASDSGQPIVDQRTTVLSTSTFASAAPVHLVPVFTSSPARVTMYAVTATGSATPGFFMLQQWRFRRIVHQAGPSEVVVLDVAPQGDALYGLITQPLVSESTSSMPALAADLQVTAVSAATLATLANIVASPMTAYGSPPASQQLPQVTLTLVGTAVQQSPSSTHWQRSDIGKTLVIPQLGSILVSQITSATVAQGYLICLVSVAAPQSNSATYPATTWTVYDFGGVTDLSTNVDQTLTLALATAQSPNAPSSTATATLSSGTSFSFSSNHVGRVLTWPSGAATILQILGPLQASVQGYGALAATTLSADQWQLRTIGSSNFYGGGQLSFSPSPQTKRWGCYSDVCRWSGLARDTTQRYIYIVKGDAINTTVQISAASTLDSPDNVELFEYTTMSAMFTNRYLLSVSTYDSTYHGSMLRNLSLFLGTQSTLGTAVVAVRPQVMSLMCPQQVAPFRIVVGCDPSLQLVLTMNDTNQNPQTVIDMSNLQGWATTYSLPYNYRPPSYLGAAVPITSNIYNAAPDQPRYNNRFAVSKQSGVYKKCAGQPSRMACGCLPREYQSLMVQDSDCINATMWSNYGNSFVPVFQVAQKNRALRPLTAPFLVVEMNNRTDWCINECTSASSQQIQATIYPAQSSSIVWQGGGLYHFRVYAPVSDSCNITTDVPIFVLNAPTRSSVQQTIMAITATIFALSLLSIYLWYSYKQT
ncbi:hypothetical protein RI367_000391 [Sorochytrium milnesiophthora]